MRKLRAGSRQLSRGREDGLAGSSEALGGHVGNQTGRRSGFAQVQECLCIMTPAWLFLCLPPCLYDMAPPSLPQASPRGHLQAGETWIGVDR